MGASVVAYISPIRGISGAGRAVAPRTQEGTRPVTVGAGAPRSPRGRPVGVVGVGPTTSPTARTPVRTARAATSARARVGRTVASAGGRPQRSPTRVTGAAASDGLISVNVGATISPGTRRHATTPVPRRMATATRAAASIMRTARGGVGQGTVGGLGGVVMAPMGPTSRRTSPTCGGAVPKRTVGGLASV